MDVVDSTNTSDSNVEEKGKTKVDEAQQFLLEADSSATNQSEENRANSDSIQLQSKPETVEEEEDETLSADEGNTSTTIEYSDYLKSLVPNSSDPEDKPSSSQDESENDLQEKTMETVKRSNKSESNLDDSTENTLNTGQSSSSAADSTTKHLEPPTSNPDAQKLKKTSGEQSMGKSGRRGSTRYPNRPGIVWRIGAKLEARDFLGKWYTAKIIEIDSLDNSILVHFDGWNSRYDEWFDMNSESLRCITRHSERKEMRSKASNKAVHKVGESVFAKWTDCRMYPGKIVGIAGNGVYEILFYDGFKKNVVAINVKTMPDEVQQEYAKAGLIPEVGKKAKFSLKDVGKEGPEKKDSKTKLESSMKKQLKTSPGDLNKKQPDKGIEKLEKDKKDKVKDKLEEPVTKSCAEKRKKHQDSIQQPPIAKKFKHEKEESKNEKKEGKKNDELKAKKEVGRPRKTEKNAPQVMDTKSDKSGDTPKPSTPRMVLASPNDTLTTEPPSEEYNCPYGACKKTFRKKSLVDYHVKYYHPEEYSPIQTSTSVHTSGKMKRKKTISVCSDDSEVSQIGSVTQPPSTGRGRGRPKKHRPSLESSVSYKAASEVLDEVMSEAETKTTTTEEYQQEVFQSEEPLPSVADEDDDDEQDEGVDRIEKDEVVNCICQINEENGLMIQCDVCLCWQHALCMELTEDTLPAKYVCYVCANPPGVRENSRFIYDQDWIKVGKMQRFGFIPEERNMKKKMQVMEATHSLVGDLLNVQQVLFSTKSELIVMKDKSHPELNLWKKGLSPKSLLTSQKTPEGDMDENKCSENSNEVKSTDVKIDDESHSEMMDLDTETTTTKDISESCASDNKDSQDTSLNNNLNVDIVKNNTENANMEQFTTLTNGKETSSKIEDIQLVSEEETKHRSCVKEFSKLGSVELKAEEKDDEFVNCSLNLLNHVSGVQDQVEDRLDLIEQQIAALEAAEQNKHTDALKDLPKVKRSVRQLLNDLGTVKRLSMYH